ncbi:DUF4097 family beta strand repeat-containing protein [Bacillus sp. FJAT-50079]|uniref:DUF4097 family beta strand repeat-containing protein n=1 Tax=Bacillus sp. FJAT-50079 TaxID=2833577 RepID=UPI001BCA3065|nr:DUF4097 family beta strand repeat-containing protein [Bacillus sp. FJAT-50079]MBS4210061.1 DUF4097 family beta strand repeat protein [Bacillus sp. FJAT-50079]
MINVKNVSIIALALFLVGIIGAALSFKFISKPEEIFEEKQVDADFVNMEIVAENAKVEIIPTTSAIAKVELTGKAKKQKFEVNVKGDSLIVQVKEESWSFVNLDFFTTGLALTIYVPEKQYETIFAKSNNGRIEAEKLEAKDIKMETDNGRIQLQDVKAANVTTKTDNGRTELKNIVAETISVKAANGKVILDNVEGELVGKANNGSITLITNQLNNPIDFTTDNGKIKIETEKEPENATFDADVANGKVRIYGHSDKHIVFGNGDHTIRLRTHNGSITVD